MRRVALIALIAAACPSPPKAAAPFRLTASVMVNDVVAGEHAAIEITTARAARYLVFTGGLVLARGAASTEATTAEIPGDALQIGPNTVTVLAHDDQGSDTVELEVRRRDEATPGPSGITEPTGPTGPSATVCLGDLGGGQATNVDVDTVGGTLTLSAGQASGTFTSRIFEQGAVYAYTYLAWTPQRPYGKELPAAGADESAYEHGKTTMGDALLSLRFNEASGGTFADSSPTNAVATCTSCPQAGVVSEINAAAHFDGVDDYLTIANAVVFERPTIAVESWLRVRRQVAGANTAQSIFGKGIGDGTNSVYTSYGLEYENVAGVFRTYMGIQGQNTMGFNRATSATSFVSFPTPWVHVVGTYDGGVIRIYVDGVEDGAFTPLPLADLVYGLSDSNDLVMGRFNPATYPQYLDADIDEINVYDGSLGPQDVRDRYLRHALRATVSVRACDDPLCSGEAFVDYSERNNPSTDLPALAISGHGGRYAQYRVTLSSRATERPKISAVSLCGTLQP